MTARVRAALLWGGIGMLCLVGIVVAIERALDVVAGPLPGPGGRATSALDERIFEQMTALLRLAPGTPEHLRFRTEVDPIAGKYNAHPLATLLHTVPGALLLALAPLQFAAAIRSRFPGLHRWSGRVLLVSALLVGLSGIYFGFFISYGGAVETAAATLFGAFLILAAVRAYASIRRRDIASHREWMIRMFATALAIAVIRVISLAMHGVARDAALFTPEVFAAVLWIGWILTLGCAELWIRRTRARTFSRPSFDSPILEENIYP